MKLEVLQWGVILTSIIVTFAIGMLWHSPLLFGKAWMDAQPHRSKSDFSKGIFFGLLLQVLATLFLAVLINFIFVTSTSIVAFIIYLSIAILLLQYADCYFAGAKTKKTLIDLSDKILGIAIMVIVNILI